MNKPFKVIGFSGSLRNGSYNKKLVDLAGSYLPEDFEYIYVDYKDIPLYQDDIETPEAVVKLTELCHEADAFLFATPLYNNSIPGVFKNMIDWLSLRPSPLAGKVAAVMGATPGVTGAENAQDHLREILSHMNMNVVPQPRALVSNVHNLVDESGKLTLDPKGDEFLRGMIDQFAKWTRLFNEEK